MEKLCSQEYPQQESDPAAELLSDMKISPTAIVISHLKYLASIFPPTIGIDKIVTTFIYFS